MGPAEVIRSAANPAVRALRRLATDSTAYREQGRLWLEGEHLCGAALAAGLAPVLCAVSETNWPPRRMDIAQTATKTIVVSDRLMASLSALPSPPPLACAFALPAAPVLEPHAPTVVLDRVQDAGNVGAILRSAAAFGFTQVLALSGTAALWSPKVLRAGQGAHFGGLRLLERAGHDDVARLAVPLLATSSHAGEPLHRARLPWPCGWLFGHEGQGVAPALQAMASARLAIAQPGGQESLNVACAAAICLHASAIAAPGPRL